MKTVAAVVILIILAGLGFYFLGKSNPIGSTGNPSGEHAVSKAAVTDGTYRVVPEESTIRWAGKKPLIEGYINSGAIGVQEGTISVENQSSATGRFVMDMNTISVTATPTKPGQESALEGHLKGERWFNVATYPTATFEIAEVSPRADSATTFMYDIRGTLTMKGESHELTFPATIYEDEAGKLHAEADFEFDRTKWGITSGSDTFFDNLADNAIDDMVALSFNLVAEKQ